MKFKNLETFAKKGEIVTFVRPEGALHLNVNPIISFDPYYELLKATEEVIGTVPGQGEVKKSTVDGMKSWQDWLVVTSLTSYSLVQTVIVEKVESVEGQEDKKIKVPESQITESGLLPWEQVDLLDLKTYVNWEKELLEFGMTELEVRRLQTSVFEINNMSDAALEKARADFAPKSVDRFALDHVMLEGRTTLYVIWRACVRAGIRPPGVGATWEETPPYVQCRMLAFEEIIGYEEAKMRGMEM